MEGYKFFTNLRISIKKDGSYMIIIQFQFLWFRDMKSGMKVGKNVRCKKTNHLKRNLIVMDTQMNLING